MSANMVMVDFHGDTIFAMETPEGVFVAVRPIVERFGLDWSAQFRRIKRDAVLGRSVVMMATETLAGRREAICLPLRLLAGFLFGIDENRVKAEFRDALIAYKEQAHEALYQRFFGGLRGHDDHGARQRSLLSLPMPDMPGRTRAERSVLNRIWHARASVDAAMARMRYLGDWIGLGLSGPEDLEHLLWGEDVDDEGF